jgi:hypothetical protein
MRPNLPSQIGQRLVAPSRRCWKLLRILASSTLCWMSLRLSCNRLSDWQGDYEGVTPASIVGG